MSVQNHYFTWAVQAGGDLSDGVKGSGHIYKLIDVDDNDIYDTAGGARALGVLQHQGNSGDHVPVGVAGIMKFTAGAVVSPGDALTPDTSGYVVKVASGDYPIGKALESITSGSVGVGLFDFAQAAQQQEV